MRVLKSPLTDAYNHRIQKFTSDGTFLRKWGSEGSGDGQFNSPYGIAVDRFGYIYVADSGNHRIQKFTGDGMFLAEWESFGYGMAVDGRGNVYVVGPGRIEKFTSDGRLLTEWGGYGSGDGQFNWCHGVAVDTSGNVYVADEYNHRIQKFAPGYPSPDPVHGLALNGSFEEMPDLVRWTYGGELPVGLVNDATHGSRAVRLGEPVPPGSKYQEMGWLRQTMYIRPEWERPVLTFRYRMFVNDIIDYSDFHVWLTRSNGAWLAEIKRDGFRSCDDPPQAPPPGYDLGWRTGYYDLSAFKGQTVRLVFENRNLHSGISWGIWTYVDDVRVVDAGPLPAPAGPYCIYLPVAMNGYAVCDPVVGGFGLKSVVRPRQP